MEYLVTWKIDIESDSPKNAVHQALEIQRDRLSTATVFQVESKEDGVKTEVWIDLDDYM